MNWRQAARLAVAAVGIGCAIAIAAYSRKRPPPARPPDLAPIEENTKATGGAGQTLMYRKGRSTTTIAFASFRAYEDGRVHYEKVVIEGLEESKFVVRANVMETAAPVEGTERPKQLLLSGGVKLKTDDGLELSSDTATWDDPINKLTMPGAVTFQKGRISGSGNGAVYDRERDSFDLLAKAQAHVNADAAGGNSADLSAARMSLFRGQHVVELNDNARIVGEAQTLTATKATLSFTEDETAMKYVDLDGAARVTPNPPKPPAKKTNSRPGMEGDKITMSFYEDGVTVKHSTVTGRGVLTLAGDTPRSVRGGWIDFTVAPDGQTLTDLQAKDRVSVIIAATPTTAGRTITATTLVATGDPKKGLTSAQFDGNPRFEETPATGSRRGGGPPAKPELRSGESVRIVLALGGQIDAIERAEFRQKAKFEDGDTKSWADTAIYEEANGLLHLANNARVETPDMEVTGSTINVDTDKNDLDAQGSVITHSVPAAGAKSTSGGLFTGDKPIIGTADKLKYTKSSGTAVYTGTTREQARLIQGDSLIKADRIDYSDQTKGLTGNGKVYSVWLLESGDEKPGTAKTLKQQTVRAETMMYDDAARKATYTGSPVNVRTDSEIEGRKVTFVLADAERSLKSMRAEGEVWATLTGGYEGRGEILTYDAKKDFYTLDGKVSEVAVVKSTDTDSKGVQKCSTQEAMRFELDRKTNKITIPGEGQAPRNNTPVPCTMSLKRSK